MAYSNESQEKVLDYLVKNFPHDMDKFEKLYGVDAEDKWRAEISIRDILFSSVWTADEKVRLIKLYGHDKDKIFTNKTYDNESIALMKGLTLIDECIKKQNFSGVQALLMLGAHISVASISRIIEYIENPSERYKFCELLVNHYRDKENIEAYMGTGNQCYLTTIPSLCDRYPIYIDRPWGERSFFETFSSMEYICATNDLELIKLFLPTIKDINPLLSFAVKSGNIEMVELFIKYGANVNFQDLEFEKDNGGTLFKTPLKIAIDNNDLEMIKFLYQNGADLSFVDKSERMQGFIGNLGKNETEKQTHQYEDYWDRHDYVIWAKTPLEYAINLGAVSLIDQDLINSDSKRQNHPIDKQLQDRLEIVKFLYENGATFGDGQVNYTDLICFAIKSDDFEATEYYFKEALKNNAKLDFVKIIDFIHVPGVVKKRSDYLRLSKSFEKEAEPWFRLCEKYSKELDEENYNRNIQLMLEKLFRDFCYTKNKFNIYRDVIKEFTKKLPKETLKEIPAIFGVSLENLEEVLNLGYDISSTNEKGDSIIMDYLFNRHVSVETLEKLISLGADINYNNGNNALAVAILCLHKYDFCEFINEFDSKTGKLYLDPEEYEKDTKALIKKIIDLSSDDIIMSEIVQGMVYCKIEPGYPQIIYNEILEALSKRGFKVEDDYYESSITFSNESHSSEYVTNPWRYLGNLYNNFDNEVKTNFGFPQIESARKYEYGTEENYSLFNLINKHLNRNFITSLEQISDPDKITGEFINSVTRKRESLTSLQMAQVELLSEIKRYIGTLNYRQIMRLLNSYPIIDVDSIVRSGILPHAMNIGDMNLCKELVKMGVSIVCYDERGHDITSKIYSAEQIRIFRSLNVGYNPNKEYEELLAHLGCYPSAPSLK